MIENTAKVVKDKWQGHTQRLLPKYSLAMVDELSKAISVKSLKEEKAKRIATLAPKCGKYGDIAFH